MSKFMPKSNKLRVKKLKTNELEQDFTASKTYTWIQENISLIMAEFLIQEAEQVLEALAENSKPNL